MSEAATRQAVHRLRCRYRELLREEVARLVAAGKLGAGTKTSRDRMLKLLADLPKPSL